MAQIHSAAVNSILLGVQRELPKARLFKRVVGAFRAVDDPARIVSVGDAGQADIYGYLEGRPYAVPFEIEVKIGRDRARTDQCAWAAMCERMGIPYVIVRAHAKADIPAAVDDCIHFIRGLSR